MPVTYALHTIIIKNNKTNTETKKPKLKLNIFKLLKTKLLETDLKKTPLKIRIRITTN